MTSKPLSLQVVGNVYYIPVVPHPDDVNISGSVFTSKSDNHSVILFEPPIKSGIVKFEVQANYQLFGLGIAQNPAKFQRNEGPQVVGKDRMIFYICNGQIAFADEGIEGNAEFDKGNYVALELNMDSNPRTLSFFIDDEEQKNYITGIPESVSFWVFLFEINSSFKVTKFERLIKPTALHGSGTKATSFQLKAKIEIEPPKIVKQPKIVEQQQKRKSSCEQVPRGPIPHSALVPSLEDTQVDKDTVTMIKSGPSTILFDSVIKKGIMKFEVLNINSLQFVGIADESVQYGRYEEPQARGWEKIVEYFSFGKILHIGHDFIRGNAEFNDGDRVALEINMDSNPRTLSFFVNDIEQPNFVTDIPSAVRIWAHLFWKDSSFKVLKFESVTEPTAKHGAISFPYEYGEFWVQGDIKNIGIADQSVIFGRNEKPETKGMENVVIYNSRGRIVHIGGKQIEGNGSFGPEDIIKLEFNMNKDNRTLTFFINDDVQKNYISDLPPKVKFWCHLKDKGSSFKIISFAKFSDTGVEHKFFSSSKYKWGKKW
ncbi:MAG: hypothetical protein EZS28_000751 [Streblomastix strix]|uniref:SPRY domain-containing protein n=1 Tax=Streblomastix strix TaxID=222440 RepID=A0A5J4X9Z7_9EUKA|nr:MAG: hypothetical protein EZS28_000751 [Streblomastix strix]